MHVTTKAVLWIMFPATLLLGVAGFVLIAWQQPQVTADVINKDNPIVITADSVEQGPDDYQLSIDEIDVIVPIIKEVSGANEQEYLRAIENGVAHYAGTPLPGNQGNSFIFGHSSYYRNKPGSYKEIFKRLNELKVGHKVTIQKGEESFSYQVINSRIVEANDTTVLDQGDREIVTLMTCWPPGTLQKRYIVQAQRVLE